MIEELALLEPGEPFVIPKGKVALVFHIPGHCAGCKRAISILKTKNLDDWSVFLINAEDESNAGLIKGYNVSTAPTIIVYENGNEINKLVGLKAFLDSQSIFD